MSDDARQAQQQQPSLILDPALVTFLTDTGLYHQEKIMDYLCGLGIQTMKDLQMAYGYEFLTPRQLTFCIGKENALKLNNVLKAYWPTLPLQNVDVKYIGYYYLLSEGCNRKIRTMEVLRFMSEAQTELAAKANKKKVEEETAKVEEKVSKLKIDEKEGWDLCDEEGDWDLCDGDS